MSETPKSESQSRETRTLRDQIRRSMEGAAWHGPALLELLAGVPAAAAAEHPLPGAHSIWELVLHLEAVQDMVARGVAGEPVPSLPDEEDWPPVPAGGGEEAWAKARARLEAGARRLDESLARFPAERLHETALGRDYTYWFMLQGLVQHQLYHAGQLAVLKRALGLEPVGGG